MSDYVHFCMCISCLSFLLFCLLLRCIGYPLTFLFPLHFHIVRVSFSFSSMSHSTDNFFLQTACADRIKKAFVSAVAVYLGNTFWSCFIQKIHVRSCVLLVLYFILHSGIWCVFQASLIWRCYWFKSTKHFWSIWVYNQIAAQLPGPTHSEGQASLFFFFFWWKAWFF